MQRLATRETAEDVRDHVSVRVEFCNIATDVLLAGVSQELEFSPVGPEDSAILCDPVQRNRGILKEVDQLPLQLLTPRVDIGGGGAGARSAPRARSGAARAGGRARGAAGSARRAGRAPQRSAPAQRPPST